MDAQSFEALLRDHPAMVTAVIIWTLVWKGLALWKAGQRGEKKWFIAILLVNTFGILDIIYYYFVGKKDESKEKDESDGVEYIEDDNRNG